MNYKGKTKGYVHKVLENYNVKESNKIERALDYKAISRFIKARKKIGDPDELIEEYIMSALEKGALKGGRGRFYTSSVPKKILRGAKQVGRKEIKAPGSTFFYLRHPVLGLRKLMGYEPEGNFGKKDLAIKKLAREWEYDEDIPEIAREKASEMSRLSSYKKAIELLQEGGLMGDYRAKTLEHRIDKRSKRNLKDLTDLISSEVSAVIFLALGAFLAGLFLGNPTGNAILENAKVTNNYLIFGIGIFIIGFLVWLYIRRK